VKGQEDELAAMEALILRLDEEPNRDRASGASVAADDPGAKPTEGIEIRSEVPGARVIRKLVPNGTKVNKGDLLVELDDSKQIEVLENLKVEMEELRAAELVTKQEAEADQMEAITTTEMELKVADLQAKGAEAEMDFERIVMEGEISLSRKTVEILKALQKQADAMALRGAASFAERHSIALEIAKAETSLNIAIAKKALLTDVVQPLKVAEAELDLVRAKANLNLARREAKLRSEEGRARLVALNAEMARKTDQLTRLEKQIRSCRILAPSRGVVRISRPSIIKPGVVVRQGQALLYLEGEDSPSAE
jgi:HlyD family secretion protein